MTVLWVERDEGDGEEGGEAGAGGQEGTVGSGFVVDERGEMGGDAGSPTGLGFLATKGGVGGDTREAGDETEGGRVLGETGRTFSLGGWVEGRGGGKCVVAFFFLKMSSFLVLRAWEVGAEEGEGEGEGDGEGGGGEGGWEGMIETEDLRWRRFICLRTKGSTRRPRFSFWYGVSFASPASPSLSPSPSSCGSSVPLGSSLRGSLFCSIPMECIRKQYYTIIIRNRLKGKNVVKCEKETNTADECLCKEKSYGEK